MKLNECQKACAVVTDKNNSFAELSKWSGMSIPRLKQLRAKPIKLETTKWIAVHKLAKMYDENQKINKMNELEYNELADLRDMAKEGIIVGTAQDIVDEINEQANNEDMTPSEYVQRYVEDLHDLIERYEDGTIAVEPNGIYVLDDASLDGIDAIELLDKRTVYRELFNQPLKAEELVKQIDEKYRSILTKEMKYPVILTEYHDDGYYYYVVTSPNIPGMVTDGDTIAEALIHAEDAIATMLDGTDYPAVQDPKLWQLKANQFVAWVTLK